jgi:hypothetical protein
MNLPVSAARFAGGVQKTTNARSEGHRNQAIKAPHRVLDVLMTQVCLQRPRVVAFVCKRVPAGMTQLR